MIKKIHQRKLIFFLSVLILLLLGLLFVKNLLVSFIISFVGFYLLSPMVDILERKGLSRAWSTSIPFFIFSLMLWVSMQLLLPLLVTQFESLKADVPKYTAGFENILQDLRLRLSQFMDMSSSESVIQRVQSHMQEAAQNLFNDLPRHISNSLTVLFLAPFLTFFMLLDGRQWVRKTLTLVPNSYFELALNLNHQISTQMGGFIRARLLEAIIVGFVIWIGLTILQFPYALVLALIAGLLNLIPYIGPFIGAAPAFFIAMINWNVPTDFAFLALVYLLGQVIDIALIVPFVVAKIVDLHPVTVVLSVMIGAQIMGVLGMIISIPVASVIKVTFQSLYTHLTDFRK